MGIFLISTEADNIFRHGDRQQSVPHGHDLCYVSDGCIAIVFLYLGCRTRTKGRDVARRHDAISTVEQELITWLREHKRRPTGFSHPSTEAEELEATVAKTMKRLRFNDKTGRVSEVVIRELNEVRGV